MTPGNAGLFCFVGIFCLFVLFLNPASRELVPLLVPPCSLCPETPPVPERPSSHIRHLAGHYICAGLVCSDFSVSLSVCSVLVYMLSSGGKSHIMLKFYRVCSKCQVVVRMVYCFGVPLLEKAPVLPSGAGFLVGGQKGGTSANLAGRLSEVPL